MQRSKWVVLGYEGYPGAVRRIWKGNGGNTRTRKYRHFGEREPASYITSGGAHERVQPGPSHVFSAASPACQACACFAGRPECTAAPAPICPTTAPPRARHPSSSCRATSTAIVTHARVSAEPRTLNTNPTPRPTNVLELAPKIAAAPLLLVPLEPEPDEPLDPLLPEPDEPLGALGVKVAEGLARQDVAAAFAPLTFEGAFAFTVAFPPKSHEVAARSVIS